MTRVVEEVTSETSLRQVPQTVSNSWLTHAHRRLTEVFEAAKSLLFDDSSRLVFFSDCHRGDNSRADAFAKNAELFLRALTHYYREGFTYIEVGDGDDLWQTRRFSDIRRAYGRIFDLLHKFDRQDRLHLIVGNHDIRGGRHERVEKDGIIAHEGLVLHHSRTGQQIFIVHGHQADFKSDRLYVVGRFLVRIWKRLQSFGLGDKECRAGDDETPTQVKIKQRIIEWLQSYQQIVICGHTHRPVCAAYGAPPYFNTGSCVYPGYITGLEIQNGKIAPIRWCTRPETRQRGALRVERELVAPPRKLYLFG